MKAIDIDLKIKVIDLKIKVTDFKIKVLDLKVSQLKATSLQVFHIKMNI